LFARHFDDPVDALRASSGTLVPWGCLLMSWRGNPTLAHGGLSLLEAAVPFIEISKP